MSRKKLWTDSDKLVLYSRTSIDFMQYIPIDFHKETITTQLHMCVATPFSYRQAHGARHSRRWLADTPHWIPSSIYLHLLWSSPLRKRGSGCIYSRSNSSLWKSLIRSNRKSLSLCRSGIQSRRQTHSAASEVTWLERHTRHVKVLRTKGWWFQDGSYFNGPINTTSRCLI